MWEELFKFKEVKKTFSIWRNKENNKNLPNCLNKKKWIKGGM